MSTSKAIDKFIEDSGGSERDAINVALARLESTTSLYRYYRDRCMLSEFYVMDLERVLDVDGSQDAGLISSREKWNNFIEENG